MTHFSRQLGDSSFAVLLSTAPTGKSLALFLKLAALVHSRVRDFANSDLCLPGVSEFASM
jgi:hypothetical protein